MQQAEELTIDIQIQNWPTGANRVDFQRISQFEINIFDARSFVVFESVLVFCELFKKGPQTKKAVT